MATKHFLIVAFMLTVLGAIRYLRADEGVGSDCHWIVGQHTCDNVRHSLCGSQSFSCGGTASSCTGGNTPSRVCVRKRGNPPPECSNAASTGETCSGFMQSCDCMRWEGEAGPCLCIFSVGTDPCPNSTIRSCL